MKAQQNILSLYFVGDNINCYFSLKRHSQRQQTALGFIIIFQRK